LSVSIKMNMQKLSSYIFFLFLVSGTCFLFSCIDDTIPSPKPEIDLIPERKDLLLLPGDSLGDSLRTLRIVVKSFDKLQDFTIISSDSSQPLEAVTSFPLNTYSTILRDKIRNNKKPGDQIIYSITATTEKNASTTRIFTVNIR
jgi:hypothetical protein